MSAVPLRVLLMVFAAAFALFVIARFPLALALSLSSLPEKGLYARDVTGSIWSGQVRGAGFGPVPLGDIGVSLSPLALLGGDMRLSFAPAEGGTGPTGSVSASRRSLALKAVTGTLPAPPIVPGIGGMLEVQNLGVDFADGSCRAAGGSVSAEVRFDAAMARLTGTAVCANDRLLLPLTGQTLAGDASLFVHIAADAGYSYELKLAAPPEVTAALTAAGFVPEGGQFVMRGSGVLQ